VSTAMEVFLSALPKVAATSHIWLLHIETCGMSPWELNFKIHAVHDFHQVDQL
jgi:hypothetical protein